MTFYVGQKVVCVDASPAPGSGRPTPLTKGRVYTISGIVDDGWGLELILKEQPGRAVSGEWRPDFGFRATRFRPVVERSTDISIFTEILDRVSGDKPRVREDAA